MGITRQLLHLKLGTVRDHGRTYKLYLNNHFD
jgi:hypothetical protein